MTHEVYECGINVFFCPFFCVVSSARQRRLLHYSFSSLGRIPSALKQCQVQRVHHVKSNAQTHRSRLRIVRPVQGARNAGQLADGELQRLVACLRQRCTLQSGIPLRSHRIQLAPELVEVVVCAP